MQECPLDRCGPKGPTEDWLASTDSAPAVRLQGLTYTVVNNSNRKEKVTLLVDVSGFLRAGELTALMVSVASAACVRYVRLQAQHTPLQPCCSSLA